ncbi:hypothetical protein MF672_011250 [Actinomadura sp. ATCC 31491]|uniref:SRPBCC family protein n=1 Tax=Actinomadura luzonensis TaxID=2805427 RepID=A0ABT0FR20_9ACTN|nr:hypothetical protein [Actinomadura luzonensis]MCK2214363.1 hypothetical protein [Actinomadura luzonensis]
MTRRLIAEVAGVVTAPVERVWPLLRRQVPAEEVGEHFLAYQGGWWYRGEWRVAPHPDGTRVEHRVYSVAGPFWAVALANRLFVGYAGRTRRSFAAGLAGIAEQLGGTARLT